MMQSKDLKTVADGNGEKHKTSVTTSVSSFFSSGGLISSAFSKASSGVMSIKGSNSPERQQKMQPDDDLDNIIKPQDGMEAASPLINFQQSSIATSASSFFNATFAAMGLDGRDEDEKRDTDSGRNKEEPALGLSSVFAKMGAATKSLKQSVEGSNIISEFNREQEKFIKEKKNSDPNAALTPWIGCRDEDGLRAKILELSKDKRNFVRAPPSGVTFDFEYESISGSAILLLKEDPNLHEMRFQLVPKIVKEDEFWRNYFYRVGLIRQQFELQDLQDTDKEELGSKVVKGNDAEEADIKDEARGVNLGSRGADEEFVSESYLASSKDIAEADESIKKLGVADEWEAELQGELNEYEVVKETLEEDNPEWENQIQEMLDAEQIAGDGTKLSD